jgi:hypothetical protein
MKITLWMVTAETRRDHPKGNAVKIHFINFEHLNTTASRILSPLEMKGGVLIITMYSEKLNP